MLDMPLVSVVITNFNYENFIADALESVKQQTYRPVECIVVDDCSKDGSVDVINEFISQNSTSGISFRLVKHNDNLGQLGGFITGIKEAKGVFVCFLDADDIYLKDFVCSHIQMHFHTNVAMSASQQIEIDEKNQIHSFYSDASATNKVATTGVVRNRPFEQLKKDIENFPTAAEMCYSIINTTTHPVGKWHWSPTSNVMFRKSALDLFSRIGNYDYWKYCADKILFNFVHILGGGVLFNTPLTAYRRHSNNNFSKACIIGNKRFFSSTSSEKIREDNENLKHHLLSYFREEEEMFLEHIGKRGLNRLTKSLEETNTKRPWERKLRALLRSGS